MNYMTLELKKVRDCFSDVKKESDKQRKELEEMSENSEILNGKQRSQANSKAWRVDAEFHA